MVGADQPPLRIARGLLQCNITREVWYPLLRAQPELSDLSIDVSLSNLLCKRLLSCRGNEKCHGSIKSRFVHSEVGLRNCQRRAPHVSLLRSIFYGKIENRFEIARRHTRNLSFRCRVRQIRRRIQIPIRSSSRRLVAKSMGPFVPRTNNFTHEINAGSGGVSFFERRMARLVSMVIP